MLTIGNIGAGDSALLAVACADICDEFRSFQS